MMSLNVASQPIQTDTIIRVKASQARKVYADALQKPILEERISILNERVANLQLLIKTMDDKDSVQKVYYEGQIYNFNQQIALYKDQINGYEKLVKKERRRRRLITGAGVLTTGAMIYLYMTK